MYQRLFKKMADGKVAYWEVETDGPQLTMRWAKSLDGKVTERHESLVGKGKQKRTDAEQADFVAQSKINGQVDDGYVFEMEHTRWPVTNSLGFPMPMLATPLAKVTGGVDYTNCHLTPKLDGHRMLLGVRACMGKVRDPRYKADGQATLYSRGSQKIDLPHILGAALAMVDRHNLFDTPLDGEVYPPHGTPLQDVKRMVARKDERLEWHLYDLISPEPHDRRRAKLASAVDDRGPLKLVPSFPVNELASRTMHNHFVAQGYEGSILRWSDNGYLTDGRPAYLTKQKDFIDEEFEILELVLDKPRLDPETGEELHCPSFICRNNDGSDTTFKVTVFGNMYEKHQAWIDRARYPGQMLTVSFQQRSKAGIPTICTALRLREDL